MANTPQPGKSTVNPKAAKIKEVKAPAVARLSMNRKTLAVRHAVSPMSAAQKTRNARILKALGD